MKQFTISPYQKLLWNIRNRTDGIPNRHWHCSVCGKDNNKEIYAIKWDVQDYNGTGWSKNYTVEDYACSPLCAEMFVFQKA